MALRTEMSSGRHFQDVSPKRLEFSFSPGHKLVLRNCTRTLGRPCFRVRAAGPRVGDVSDASDTRVELGRRALLAGVAISTGVLGNIAGCVAPGWAATGVLEPEIYGDKRAQDVVYDATQEALVQALQQRREVPFLGGLYLRAAFHDAGTWSAKKGTGGANGSLQFEIDAPQNLGLKPGIDILVEVKKDLNRAGVPVTMADTFQIAGAEGMAIAGGPKTRVPIGRKDATKAGSSDELPDPNSDADTLKELFLRNGYTVQDLVALSGSHTIGISREHPTFGPMDSTPGSFDNDYYKRVLEGKGNFRSDNALATDPETAPFVQRYARDRRAFTRDFVSAYLKMGQFGANGSGTVAPRIAST